MIYNGIADNNYTIDDFAKPYTKLRLLDNDNDGEYEVVFADYYVTMLVKNVVNNDGTIIYIGEDGTRITIDGESKWGRVETFGEAGVPPQNVESGDLLIGTVSRNGRVYNLQAGIKTLEGTVEKTTDNGICGTVFIDDKEYEVHSYYKTLETQNSKYAEEIVPGTYMSFVVDKQNRIVAVNGKNSDWQYGFILIAAVEEIERTPVLRVLGEDGEIRDFRLSGKTNIDGSVLETYEIAGKIDSGEFSEGMVKLKLRQNKISAIRTPASGTAGLDDGLKETVCSEGLYYLARLNCLYYLNYRMEAHTNPNSLVFYVATHPDGTIAAKETKQMRVSTLNGAIRDWDNTYFDAYYDKDEETKTPEAYLRYIQVGSAVEPVDEASPIAIVEKITQTLDEESGEILYSMKGFNNTGEFERTFEPEITAATNPLQKPSDIMKGDMIVYEENNGRIVAFDVLYRISRDKNAVENATADGPFYVYSDALVNQMTGRQRLNYGILLSKNSSLISVVDRIPSKVTDDVIKNRTEIYNIPHNIYIYSEETGKIRKGTSNDLDNIIYSVNPNARIMIYTHEGYMQYAVAFEFK